MSIRVRVPMIVAVLLSMMLLAGCGAAATPDPVTPPAASGTAGILDGSTLVDTVCTKCHPRDRIDQASKDLAGWQSTINRMVSQHGAKVTTEEQSAIAIYLSNR
jgi:hypothetical protein